MDSIQKLIEKFINASIRYGEAIELGDSQKANLQSSIIRKVRKQLLDISELESLLPNMTHENNYVKLNVAASLISLFPSESKEILIELQKKKGLLGFEAKMFLQQWERGNMNQ